MKARLRLDLRVALDRFDLSVVAEADFSCLGIFGPSGAGKTTLLESIAGLRGDVRGSVALDGEVWTALPPPEHRRIGYVPQDGLLFPHRDVAGNLEMGAARARDGRGASLGFDHVVDVLEIRDLLPRPVGTLSGGERQRVALGRALCSAPRLLLLDEPLAGLDVALRRRILPYLLRVRDEFAVPTIHVSHDPTEVRFLCDAVLVLERGAVVARGAPDEVLLDPSVLPTSAAEGIENVVRGSVVSVEGALVSVALGPGRIVRMPAAGHEPGDPALATIRPEDLLIATSRPSGLSARNALPAIVREIRSGEASPAICAGEAGPVWVFVEIRDTGAVWSAAITEDARRALDLDVGREVHVVFKTHACHPLPALRGPTGGAGR